jgi:hypothetical protein
LTDGGGLTCDNCGAALADSAYEVKAGSARLHICFRCVLRYRPFIVRAVFIALFVGTFLTLVNQGGIIIDGDWPAALYWKVPLTYSVPFCVSAVSSILASRTKL